MREVGAVLDANAVHGGRSVRSHLAVLAQSNGIPQQRVSEVLDIVGLSSVARKRCRGLSLGMKQRLGIAGALLGDPGILMFDEPVNGLDPEGVRWIRNLMKSFAAEGRTVFVSSHLMSEMQHTADHLIVIGRGKLIAACPVGEFISRSADHVVRVRTPQAGALSGVLAEAGGDAQDEETSGPGPDGVLTVRGLSVDRIGDLAFEHGIRLHELTLSEGSLEEAFMELTAEGVEFRGTASVQGGRQQAGAREGA
jgi:ABC-2 type transport system ATP-binding protein